MRSLCATWLDCLLVIPRWLGKRVYRVTVFAFATSRVLWLYAYQGRIAAEAAMPDFLSRPLLQDPFVAAMQAHMHGGIEVGGFVVAELAPALLLG